MTTNTPPSPPPLSAPQAAPATPRCPECGTSADPKALARTPWLLRRLPILAVAVVFIVMLALLFIPRLTMPGANWLPSWNTIGANAPSTSQTMFVSPGYTIADVRALAADAHPPARPTGHFVHAISEILRDLYNADLSDDKFLYTTAPKLSLSHIQSWGWPMPWRDIEHSLTPTDLKSTLKQPPTETFRSLAWMYEDWNVTGPYGVQITQATRGTHPLTLLLPPLLSIAAFETVRRFLPLLPMRRLRIASPQQQNRSATKIAGWTAIVVFLAFSIAMIIPRDERLYLGADVFGLKPPQTTARSSLTFAEFEVLTASVNADRALARHIISNLAPDIPDDHALLIGSDAIEVGGPFQGLILGSDLGVSGYGLLTVFARERTHDNPPPPQFSSRNVSFDVDMGSIIIQFPLDPSTRATATIGLSPLIFWFTLAAAAMYTARLTRYLYRRAATNRRRRKGECLHCRYHLRPT